MDRESIELVRASFSELKDEDRLALAVGLFCIVDIILTDASNEEIHLKSVDEFVKSSPPELLFQFMAASELLISIHSKRTKVQAEEFVESLLESTSERRKHRNESAPN